MSDLDFFAGPPGGTNGSVPALPATTTTQATPAPRRRRLSRGAAVGAGTLVVVALIAMAGLWWPEPRDDRPVVMPQTLDGRALAEQQLQFGSTDWRTGVTKYFGTHPFDGAAYGGVRPGPLLHLIVSRTGTDSNARAMRAQSFTSYGAVECTRTFDPDEKSLGLPERGPQVSSAELLCHRSRDTLTVSVLSLVAPDGFESEAAAAVDEAWALNQ